MRLFQSDPLSHIPREQATVGALRAQAKDVDLSLKSHGGLQPREGKGIVTAGQGCDAARNYDDDRELTTDD